MLFNISLFNNITEILPKKNVDQHFMEIFDSCGECIICDAAASAEHSIGIRCREGHYVCRRDLNQYMSHNVLSQLYKLKFNKCEVSCPETDCTATYDTLKLFDALEANERNRYIQIVSSMAADSSSPIIGIKNSLLDSLSLKCPHCSIAVDPAPDACSAVSCLSCGYFYCNCCFLSFGKGQLDRGSRDAHEHCALHDILRPRDQRSAFLTAETIEAGHRDTRKANFLTVLHDHFYRDGANRHEVLLATILCNDELKDADINIREAVGVVDSRCVNPGTTLASAVDLLHQLPMEAQEKNDDPKTTLLAQLANAMHQENAAASAQLLASMQDQDFDPNFTCDHCGQNLLILALFHGDRHVAETLLTGGRGFDPLCIMTNGQLAGQRTALYIAAEKGYMAELRLMMEVPGVSPASQASFDDNFGLTPLHVAVQYGQMAVVLYFIDELNADVNMPAALSPTTPLMAAVQFGKDDIVEVLVRRGARLDVQSREGRYPMYLAVEKGLVSTVKLLVNVCNVDINAPTTSEPTMGAALWIAIQCNKFYLIPLLISLGANVNAPDKEFGFTPLHYAILKGLNAIQYISWKLFLIFPSIFVQVQAMLSNCCYFLGQIQRSSQRQEGALCGWLRSLGCVELLGYWWKSAKMVLIYC